MLDHMLEWYDLTDEERRIRDLALQVAREDVAPRARTHDEHGTFVRDSLDAMAEAGLLGVNVPKEYGGMGGSALAAVMTLEAISAACGSTGAVFMLHANLVHVLCGAGPESLRRKYLPDLAAGRKLGGVALNERVVLFRQELQTTIEDRDDHYLLNGLKPFANSVGEADVTLVQAQKVGGPPVPFPIFNQELLLVEKGAEGIDTELYDPMGLRGASNGRLTMTNVEVAKENVVGDEPGGMIRGAVVKGNSVLGPNVISSGLAGASLEAAVRYARKHRPRDWVKHAIAPLSDQLNALRAYNYYGARIMTGGFDDAMALCHIEVQRLGGASGYSICDRVMEVVGGSSLMRSSPLQRNFRDARACAYLAFSMEARRSLTADILYGIDIDRENPEPPSMPWDRFAAYSFRMSSVAAHAEGLPDQARERLGRGAIEDWVRAQGLAEVSFEAYMRYRAEVLPQLGAPPEGAKVS